MDETSFNSLQSEIRRLDIIVRFDDRVRIPQTKMIQIEYWGLSKALKIIEACLERLEGEAEQAREKKDAKQAAKIFQQTIAVNEIHTKVQDAVIVACDSNNGMKADRNDAGESVNNQ